MSDASCTSAALLHTIGRRPNALWMRDTPLLTDMYSMDGYTIARGLARAGGVSSSSRPFMGSYDFASRFYLGPGPRRNRRYGKNFWSRLFDVRSLHSASSYSRRQLRPLCCCRPRMPGCGWRGIQCDRWRPSPSSTLCSGIREANGSARNSAARALSIRSGDRPVGILHKPNVIRQKATIAFNSDASAV